MTLHSHLVLALASCLGFTSFQDGPSTNPFVLTLAEKELVHRLAEQALREQGLYRVKVVLCGLEVFRDGPDPVSDRRVLATHYRYEGDVALLTSIDLGQKKVVRVQEVPHMPTSLAAEEMDLAEKLARADPTVAKILARYGAQEKIEADCLAHFTADPKAPGYRHRVVRMMFRQGRTYLLYGPMVDVDLTTGQVRVEYSKAQHKP